MKELKDICVVLSKLSLHLLLLFLAGVFALRVPDLLLIPLDLLQSPLTVKGQEVRRPQLICCFLLPPLFSLNTLFFDRLYRFIQNERGEVVQPC